MTLWQVARTARRAAQLQSATKHPGRYVKNRAKSRALRQVGFWRAWSRMWRA